METLTKHCSLYRLSYKTGFVFRFSSFSKVSIKRPRFELKLHDILNLESASSLKCLKLAISLKLCWSSKTIHHER